MEATVKITSEGCKKILPLSTVEQVHYDFGFLRKICTRVKAEPVRGLCGGDWASSSLFFLTFLFLFLGQAAPFISGEGGLFPPQPSLLIHAHLALCETQDRKANWPWVPEPHSGDQDQSDELFPAGPNWWPKRCAIKHTNKHKEKSLEGRLQGLPAPLPAAVCECE